MSFANGTFSGAIRNRGVKLIKSVCGRPEDHLAEKFICFVRW